jgi:hypothetical protein
MLWGHLVLTGPGALVKVKDRSQTFDSKWNFQQENNHRHTSKTTKKCLIGLKINIL